MAAYIIVDTNVKDPESYEEYKALARPIAEKFGGRYVVRGGTMHVIDKDLWEPTRMVVLEFPDMDSALAFATGEEYAPVAELRHRYADSTLVVVEGV